jgi:hypothetical protein
VLSAGTLSCCKIQPFLQTSGRVLLMHRTISSRFQRNTADLPSSCWEPTLPLQYPGYWRKQHGLELQITHAFAFWSWRCCWLWLHWLPLGFTVKPQSITEKFTSRISSLNFMLTCCTFLHSSILRPRVRKRLYLNTCPLVLNDGIEPCLNVTG